MVAGSNPIDASVPPTTSKARERRKHVRMSVACTVRGAFARAVYTCRALTHAHTRPSPGCPATWCAWVCRAASQGTGCGVCAHPQAQPRGGSATTAACACAGARGGARCRTAAAPLLPACASLGAPVWRPSASLLKSAWARRKSARQPKGGSNVARGRHARSPDRLCPPCCGTRPSLTPPTAGRHETLRCRLERSNKTHLTASRQSKNQTPGTELTWPLVFARAGQSEATTCTCGGRGRRVGGVSGKLWRRAQYRNGGKGKGDSHPHLFTKTKLKRVGSVGRWGGHGGRRGGNAWHTARC